MDTRRLWCMLLLLLVMGNALAIWFLKQLVQTEQTVYGIYMMLVGAAMAAGGWFARRIK